MAKTYTDYPESASNNAKRAIEIKEENDRGCGTQVGWTRARQLANREAITLETVKRMASFNRHRQNSDGDPREACGPLMWLAWGGDSGINWAIKKSEQEMEKSVKAEQLVNQLRDAAESYEETADGMGYMIGETVKILDDEGNEVSGVIENEEMGIFDVRVYAQAGDKLVATDEVVYRFTDEMEKYREQPTPDADDEEMDEMAESPDDEDGDLADQLGDEEAGDADEAPADTEGEEDEKEVEIEPEDSEEPEEEADDSEEDAEDSEEDEEDEEDDEEEMPRKGMMVRWTSEAGPTVGRVLDTKGNIEVYALQNGTYVPTTIQVKQDLSKVRLTDVDVKKTASQLLCKMMDVKMDYDEDKQIGTIKGYASTYGNVDLGGDTVAKGAYKQTLYHKGGKVKLFLDHSWKVSDMVGLAYLEDKEDGLYMEAEMPLKATDVRNTFEKLMFLQDRGEQMGLSIGYDAIKADYGADGTRVLKEIALHEVSVTPFPMDTEANILDARIKRIQYKQMQKQWQKNVADAAQ